MLASSCLVDSVPTSHGSQERGNSHGFLHQGGNPSARDFVKKALGTCK